jgi:glyoxylase-like metal-dependent hydrolase (beta-lactamase superfamily II)
MTSAIFGGVGLGEAGAVSMTDPPILDLGYRSTNYWVVGNAPARLLVDLGWPSTLGTLMANLSRKGIPIHELRYALATHYHMDHAGLAHNGAAFTGDLPPENLAFDNPTALASWKLLREKGARIVYPGHGPGHGPVRTLV